MQRKSIQGIYPFTTTQKTLETFSWLLFLGIAGLLMHMLGQPSERLAVRFDLDGNPVRWGDRSNLLELTALLVVVQTALSTLVWKLKALWPHLKNLPAVEANNEQHVFQTYRTFLQTLRLVILMLLGVMVWQIHLASTGVAFQALVLVLPLVLMMPVLIGVFMGIASKPSRSRA
ncbi:hypothetical protein [Deinococcus misasensis]|uniref:hypothetical protein n=1 Tax=Deinococcus misasensis TaxID=392413 RepID=UPI0005542041|nr:hypothetical protein [Deinococcus misasensis]